MANKEYPQLTQVSPGVQYFGGARMALLDIQSGFWSIRRQLEALVGSQLTSDVLRQAGINGGVSYAEGLSPTEDYTEQWSLFENCMRAYQIAGFGEFKFGEIQWPIGKVVIQAQNTIEAWMMHQHNQQVDSPICAYSAGVLVGFVNVISKRKDIVCIEHSCQALGDETCVFELLPFSQTSDRRVIAFNPDPKLGRQVNLLETLFGRMPMGIAFLDREYHIQRYNPTWKEFSERYGPPTAAPLEPGVYYFDHLPGSEPIVIPLFERVLAGENIRQDGMRFESGGIVSYWDVVLAPIMEHNEVSGILNVTIDVTERVLLQQNLEQLIDERTRELQMLLDVVETANSSLDLDETLKTTLDLLINLIEASCAGVMLRNEKTGGLEAYRFRPEKTFLREELDQILSVCEVVASNGETLYIDPDAELSFVEPSAFLPLRVRDRILGVLVIIGSGGKQFSPELQSLFKSIGKQLGVAVENARLYDQAEQAAIATERNRLARDLHDAVTQTLFSASLIADVLPKLWKKNPETGRQKLEELKLLTRGALSEMRTLLWELRPAGLVEMDLGDLIRHLANAFTGRTRIPVKLTLEGQVDPSPDVKEIFYRIAQEALNNINKHAKASKVFINLTLQENQVEMLIQDNGRGFDLESISPENLGLGIMHERAASIGADLVIESQINEGTCVKLLWRDSYQ